MLLFLRILFLALALFSPPLLAVTIPQGTALVNPLSTNLSLNATSNSAFVCSRRGRQMYNEPGFADCAGVLRSVSLDSTVGIFYNAGQGDFQLPFFASYRGCTVLVEVRSVYDRVRTSWLAVHMAAMELNAACQDVRTAPGLAFAYTYIDELDRMKVTLKGPGGRLSDGTDASETS